MVAVCATRLVVPPRAIWTPLPADGPDGPVFSVLAKGRVEALLSISRRHVSRLSAGTFVPEGLIASFEAIMVGELQSEAYRVRLADLAVAASSSMVEGKQWKG
eukprot:CAMPEP_0206503560 /NCGR_PEP_ID=MMETSP0324_2-20121206/54812_1 /ASSEMBLY_ACC=CAM_ASM_000836 /TAXON_ID=2866 /ORGANISM="Crypthecodinium cohnii, Strain Seligo" /LENGTH=102 /DNA_ID=CAMNT_0053992261 /DNA_START=81 /DNA_END=386 /DNA_ORIENTATION=+